MLNSSVPEALTFDDVLLLPAYSQVLPSEVDLRTRLTRDIALLLSLHLGRVARRADLAAVVYWLVLYGLVPMLLKVFDGDAALPVFLPVPWADPLIAILPVFLQAAVMVAFLIRRWRAYEMRIDAGATA